MFLQTLSVAWGLTLLYCLVYFLNLQVRFYQVTNLPLYFIIMRKLWSRSLLTIEGESISPMYLPSVEMFIFHFGFWKSFSNILHDPKKHHSLCIHRHPQTVAKFMDHRFINCLINIFDMNIVHRTLWYDIGESIFLNAFKS